MRNSGTTASLYAVTYGNGTFVAVGSTGVRLVSSNGSNWATGSFGNTAAKTCIGFGNGYFFTASQRGIPPGDTNNVVVSTNASTWLGLNASNRAGDCLGASFVGGVYFLVGRPMTILTATNLNVSCLGQLTNCAWTLRSSGGNIGLGGVAYGNNVYVVVGESVAMTSSNVVSWTTNSVFSRAVFDVAFGNGVFVAVGTAGSIYVSSDGQSWTDHSFGTNTLNRMVFGNGTFVAAGNQGTILASSDGKTWKRRSTPTTAPLAGVAFGYGTFVACAVITGIIIQSGDVSIPSLTTQRDSSGGGVALTMTGEIGRGYRIQARTDLSGSKWEDFLSFTNTAPTMDFLDTSVTNLPARFYRVVSP